MSFNQRSRIEATRGRRPQSFRPRVDLLEMRTQPGSLLWGDMGMSLAAPALELDLASGNGGPGIHRRLVLRREIDGAVAGRLTLKNESDEVAISNTTAPVKESNATSVTDGLSLASSAAPTATHQMAAAIRPASTVTDASQTARATSTRQPNTTSRHSLPPPVQTPMQRTTPIHAQVQMMTDYEVEASDVTGRPQQTKAQMDWASFSGTPKQSTFASVAASKDGQWIYAVGQQGTPAQGTDFIAYKIKHDGTEAHRIKLTQGTITLGTDVVVRDDGVVFVVGGTRPNGNIDPFIARIKPDFTGFDWVAVVPNPVVSGDVFNGLTLNNAGDTLWVGGVWNSTQSGGHSEDVVVGKYTDLDNPAGPNQDALVKLVFTNPSVGSDIVRSNTGELTLCGNSLIAGARAPSLFRVDSNLANQQLAFYALPGTSNEFSRLDVDRRGNVYGTGRAALSNTSVVDMLMVKYSKNFTEGWSYQFDNPVDATKDYLGSAIAVMPNGVSYVAGRDRDDVLVVKFEADGATIRDSITVGGTPSGTFDGKDGALGIARTSDDIIYACGRADSPNFPVTPGAFVPHYNNLPGDAISMQFSHFA